MLFTNVGDCGGDRETVSEADREANGESRLSLCGDYCVCADYVAFSAIARDIDAANGGVGGFGDIFGMLHGE